ncbi:MAG: hypothetical protein AAFV33_16595 [Chloroflexota bacterium]
MTPLTVRAAGRISLFWLVMLCAAALLLRNDPILPALFSAPGCTHPCWNGLQTEVSTLDDVRARFDDSDMTFQVLTNNTRRGPTMSVMFQSTSNRLYLVDNMVRHITISGNLCIAEVLAAYGTPTHFSITPDGRFSVFYLGEGLVLHGHEHHVTLVEITNAGEVHHRLRNTPRYHDCQSW